MSGRKLVTWNINSIRARLGLVEDFVKIHDPDIICFQETKVEDNKFPHGFFEELGFNHRSINGQKSYHGVAIISKQAFKSEEKIDWCQMGDTRHNAVTLEDDTVIHNFYVPAGGDEPDPAINDKFAHKMQFLDEMAEWAEALPKDGKHILVGDLNIAPYENDVWSHKQLLKVVSHTPIECEKLIKIMQSHDWHDVMRQFVPESEKLFSWWSYRSRDFRKSNRGRRLDHVWASQALKDQVTSMQVYDEARAWVKPSDHAPVIIEF